MKVNTVLEKLQNNSMKKIGMQSTKFCIVILAMGCGKKGDLKKKRTEEQEQPDNIAVSTGKNPYSKEESEKFKEAIQKQISEQLSGYSDVTMTASGFQSGDNTVYLFTVEENDTGLITNQFYIVGEKKYCLVQESNFDKSEKCNSVAKKLVESFKWK